MPVEIGGLQISPGDLLHGDYNGIHSVPLSIVDDLPHAVAEIRRHEAELISLCRDPDFSFEKLEEALRTSPATGVQNRRFVEFTAHGVFRRQTRALLWGGFGGLLLLMAVLGLRALSFTSQIEVRQEQIRQDYVSRDRTLEKLRSEIYLSGTYVRDYLLDNNDEAAADAQSRLLRSSQPDRIRECRDYARLVRPGERAVFDQFRKELQGLSGRDRSGALDWTADQRRDARAMPSSKRKLLPRRMLTVDLTDRMHELTEKQLDASSQDVRDLFSSFRTRLVLLLVFTLGAGLLLAGILPVAHSCAGARNRTPLSAGVDRAERAEAALGRTSFGAGRARGGESRGNCTMKSARCCRRSCSGLGNLRPRSSARISGRRFASCNSFRI